MDVRYRPGLPVPPLQNISAKIKDNFDLRKQNDNENENPGAGHRPAYNKDDDNRLSPYLSDNPVQQNQSKQSFVCFKEISVRAKSGKLWMWNMPFKFVQIAVRELSVLLILIETLVLLGGYLLFLGVHHSIRYCLSKLRNKGYVENNRSQPIRNYYQQIPRPDAVPRRVPRGRMAGG